MRQVSKFFGRCLLCLLLGTGLTPGQTQSSAIAQLAWLTGCWAREGKEAGTGETWMPPAGGTMLGMSRSVKDGKTNFIEFLQIRTGPESKLQYVVLMPGQTEVAFTLTKLTATEAVFENPAHDFPQRIIYRREGKAKLFARIEGPDKGKTVGIDFPMRRISCEKQE